MSVPASPPGSLPPDYKEVLHWRVTQSIWRVIILNLLTVPLGIVIGTGFFIFLILFGRPPIVRIAGSSLQWILLLLCLVLVLILHEWVHGFTMQAYGARPRYGIIWKGLMLYSSAPGYPFIRNQYVVIALAPLVTLSLLACLSILLLAGYQAVWFIPAYTVVNGAGSIGDMWISSIVLGYRSQAYVVDEQDGMRVFLPTN